MLKKLKFVIPLIIFFFLIRSVLSSSSSISDYLSDFSPGYLLLSFILMLFIYPEGAFIWNEVLKGLGINSKVKQTLPIWIISNTSRYIPGTVWQYIGRVQLSHTRLKFPRKKVAFSLVYEVLMALMAASFCASFSFLFIREEYIVLPFILTLFYLIILNKKSINVIFKIISKVRKIGYENSVTKTGSVFLLSVLNFVLNGLALYFLILSINGHLNINFVLAATAFYSASWGIGFVSIFAPGGLGVTEVSLATLLSFFMPFPVASAISLMYRFLLTLAEGVVFTTVVLYEKRQKILGGEG